MNQIGIETLHTVGGEFCLRWSVALLHFLWQGAVIGVLVIAAGRLLRKRSAGTRYTLHAMALLSLPVCLAVTFAALDVPPSMRAIMVQSRATAFPDGEPFSILATPGEIGGGEDVRVAAKDTPIERELPASDAKRAMTPVASPNTAPPFLSRAAPLVTGIYLAGVLCFFIRFALAIWGGHRLRWSAARVDDLQLLELIVDQAHKIGLRFVPLVTYCEKVAVPTVVGVIRPVILIPLSSLTGLEPQQLAIIIGHELAHIRRYDLAMNLVQRVIESLLFFHPVVWYVSRRMSAERETCCDDLVLGSGCERTCYAGAILRMAEVCAARPGPGVAALAASGNTTSQFELRIRRLMSASGHSRLRLTRTGAAMFALLLASVVLTPAVLHSWVHAQHATDAVTIGQPVKRESLSETGDSVAAAPEGDAALEAAEEPTRRGAADLAPPVRVMAGGKPIDVGGCAAPFFGDFDGDGRKDLLVGQYDYGRLRIYRNIGANAQPKFDSFEWFKAGGRIAGVPSGCISGFAPQLVDLDA
ncbi:MAG: M48 family metalloprotease, partial [Planctomycetes bacterium]|nr:M48 family metalloprotease [Planctomycetota bacterium]